MWSSCRGEAIEPYSSINLRFCRVILFHFQRDALQSFFGVLTYVKQIEDDASVLQISCTSQHASP